MNIHPFVKYATALLLEEKSLEVIGDIKKEHICAAIQDGINSFSLIPFGNYEGKNEVLFSYSSEKSDAKKFFFLAPNIITTDMQAAKMKKAAEQYLEKAHKGNNDFLREIDNMTLSQVPICGEFASFSGIIGRGKAKASKLEQGLGIICSLTKNKPCLQFVSTVSGKIKMENICVIPDLEIPEMRIFYRVFKRLLLTETSNELLKGRVKIDETSSKTTYKPSRPRIFRGNYPSAPLSSALGTIGLLAAIGDFGSKSQYSDEVNAALESLKNRNIYVIKYGDANVFSYNNHIIDLAKEAKLKEIVDCIYRVELYNKGRRNSSNNSEYQTLDLFTSRFLQSFNAPTFRDFFSFRAEYPIQLDSLFITYFSRMENINLQIIESAKALGFWLNKTAFHVANQSIENGIENRREKVRQKKAKTLVELESSIFSAKSGDALIAQTITRAGRLSEFDAPNESISFIKAVISGDLELETAKNILIAFARINTSTAASLRLESEDSYDEMEETEIDDFTNI